MLSGGGHHSLNFCDVISLDNLFAAWREFRRGKRSKSDVSFFELNLEENLIVLHECLTRGRWQPDLYRAFFVRDPKLRKIHKASVRDRILYQAVYRKLYQVFDPTFLHDSYSSRFGKGTHAGFRRLEQFAKKVTRNFRRQAFCLKCDVRKFFDSVNHNVLLGLIGKKITDRKSLELIRQIVCSFEVSPGKGLPLGNVTSQLFANIYLNKLDKFVKHKLKQKYYIRYCDDFIILSPDKSELFLTLRYIVIYLKSVLNLDLHPNKIYIRKISQGVDFLGYVSLPHRTVLRTKTRRRIMRLVDTKNMSSYFGLLSHCRGRKIKREILEKLKHKALSDKL